MHYDLIAKPLVQSKPESPAACKKRQNVMEEQLSHLRRKLHNATAARSQALRWAYDSSMAACPAWQLGNEYHAMVFEAEIHTLSVQIQRLTERYNNEFSEAALPEAVAKLFTGHRGKGRR